MLTHVISHITVSQPSPPQHKAGIKRNNASFPSRGLHVPFLHVPSLHVPSLHVPLLEAYKANICRGSSVRVYEFGGKRQKVGPCSNTWRS